ncbi:hypothetical protein PoB_005116300 [Plakobranchus ocellatus]|uniref:UMA domain-containing protein n=1 Tax=Plakobranchus ocellatus TaxID=259542 RepID=A0AAV4C0Q4_9GAST|nr:hypothetical protein PoB_005116300 [Plakobranchus ocellatus]
MDVSRLFSNLRNQVSFHKLKKNFTDNDSDASHSTYEEEQEIDGFLVVGKARGSDVGHVLGQDGLPRHNAVCDGSLQQSSPLPSSDRDAKVASIFQSTNQSRAVPGTAVSDVPLALHPFLRTHQHITSMFKDVDLEHTSFKWTKYSYDFTNEQLFLRDVNIYSEIPLR